MADEILKKIITVQEIGKKSGEKNGKQWSVYKIVDQYGNKYTIWPTKKDGGVSKAGFQLKEQSVMVDSMVGIAYKEEDGIFVNDQGKEINFKQRTILFFAEPSQMELWVVASAPLYDRTAPQAPQPAYPNAGMAGGNVAPLTPTPVAPPVVEPYLPEGITPLTYSPATGAGLGNQPPMPIPPEQDSIDVSQIPF